VAPLDDLPEGTIKVLQITDTHLYSDPQGALLGLKTLPSFSDVLQQALNEAGKADLILATGDLVHDASPTGYKRAGEIFSRVDCPVYAIPGNHDIPELMYQHMAKPGVSMPFAVHQGNWLVVLMDSSLRQSDGGHFTQEQLDKLETALTDNPEAHVLISMHHQPVAVGSGWMDTMLIDNADDFFRIVDAHDNVRCILWGHIHQTYQSERNGVPLLATPSTCIQFTPKKHDFGIDNEPPGYRWLGLLADGTVKSAVLRLPEVPNGIDFNSFGY
jgi:Icc protein